MPAETLESLYTKLYTAIASVNELYSYLECYADDPQTCEIICQHIETAKQTRENITKEIYLKLNSN